MHRYVLIALIAFVAGAFITGAFSIIAHNEYAPSAPESESVPDATGGSVWGAHYFPNVPLVTHEGREVRFFDDLIQDKVVAINFIR